MTTVQYVNGGYCADDASSVQYVNGGYSQVQNKVTTGSQTIGGTLDVTSTLTAFGYLAVGGNAGVTGSIDVGGSDSGDWGPRDNVLISASARPEMASGTNLVTNGTIYLVKLPVPRVATPVSMYWYVTTGATTATASSNWVCLVNSSGVLVGSPVDVGTASQTSGLKTTTIAPGALAVGNYWAALVFNASTPPTLASTPATALTTLSNVGLAAAAMRFATNGTSQTTLTARTMSSNSAGPSLWVGIG